MPPRSPLPPAFGAAFAIPATTPVGLTDADRDVFRGHVTNGGTNINSLPLEPRYVRLFRRVTSSDEVWANGVVHVRCCALIDLSQLPAAWASDRRNADDDSPLALSLLASLWSDLITSAKVKVKVWGAAGAACTASLAISTRAKIERLVDHHRAWIGEGPAFLGEVADGWVLPAAQGLLEFGDFSAVIALAPRLMTAVGEPPAWRGLAGLRMLCEAYVQSDRIAEGVAMIDFTTDRLDELRPDLLPPFADGRHMRFREMPLRAWGGALAALARLRIKAGARATAAEALQRALSVADTDERRRLAADPDLGPLLTQTDHASSWGNK